VTPHPHDYPTLFKVWQAHSFDLSVFATGSTPDPDIAAYQGFHTGGGRNWTGYSNPEVDAALEQARRAPTLALRKQAYAKFQHIVADEAPACFMFHEQRWYAFGKQYKGFQYLGVSAGVLQSLRNVWIQK
jgi:peptide/nickel transport system substrate-binding protein